MQTLCNHHTVGFSLFATLRKSVTGVGLQGMPVHTHVTPVHTHVTEVSAEKGIKSMQEKQNNA